MSKAELLSRGGINVRLAESDQLERRICDLPKYRKSVLRNNYNVLFYTQYK